MVNFRNSCQLFSRQPFSYVFPDIGSRHFCKKNCKIFFLNRRGLGNVVLKKSVLRCVKKFPKMHKIPKKYLREILTWGVFCWNFFVLFGYENSLNFYTILAYLNVCEWLNLWGAKGAIPYIFGRVFKTNSITTCYKLCKIWKSKKNNSKFTRKICHFEIWKRKFQKIEKKK